MILKHTDDSIRLTGRWDITTDTAVTTAPGSMIEIAYKGKDAVLLFDTDMNADPAPHLWIEVDGGAKIEVPVDRYIRIGAKELGNHVIRVIYKGGMEVQHRWYLPLVGKISFVGAEADEAGVLPDDNRKIIEFIGDSITEGVLIDAFRNPRKIEQKNRVYQDDSTATYAYLTATALGMKPHIMGYGAVGITKTGCGSVPKAIDSYPYNFDRSDAKPSGAEIIVINHGANDQSSEKEAYLNGYREFLDLVRKINPDAKIAVLSAFCGFCHEELSEMVKSYNEEKKDNIYYIDSYGWQPSDEPLHPFRTGHRAIAERLTEELKKIL